MKKEMTVAICVNLSLFSFHSFAVGTEAAFVTNGIHVLQTKGIHGFCDLLSDHAGSAYTIAIPGAESSMNHQVDEDAQQMIPAKRELGRQIISSSLETLQSPKLTLSDLDAIMKIRSWILSGVGFGNLAASYALEENACKGLFRIASSNTHGLEAISERLANLQRETPSSQYWKSVLKQEGKELEIIPLYPDKTNDCYRVAEILRAASNGKNQTPFGSSMLQSFSAIYEKGDVVQMPIHVLTVSMRKSALEAFLAIRGNTATLPANQEAMKALAQKYATDPMSKNERLGGAIDAISVWDLWKDSLQ